MEWLLCILAFFLCIVFVLLSARPKKAAKQAAAEAAILSADSSYINQALGFLAFYEGLPQKSPLIITPTAVGTVIADARLGTAVDAFLSQTAQTPWQVQTLTAQMLSSQARLLGGERGTRRYHQLGLRVTLHDNDVSQPFVYLPLAEADRRKREDYGKTMQKIYRQMYGKPLKVQNVNAY